MKILVAIDDSSHSQAAVDEVARRPWPPGSAIKVISVIQPYVPLATEFVVAGATLDDMRQQQVASAEHITRRAAATLNDSGLSAEAAVREGDPRSAIIDEANELGADLIVVGSHGRTGLTRWLLGSVAQAVVGHAPCSVEVVRTRESQGPTRPSAS